MSLSPVVHQRKAPPRRTTSNPFTRKPVPREEEEDYSHTPPKPARKRVASFSSLTNLGGSGILGSAQEDLLDPANHLQHPHSQTRRLERKSSSTLERHLTLFDLIAIGVGGTIGSGLFVLAGLVANQYAGPATTISWCLSGLAACLSGFCYAELSGRIPLSGSAYAYTYVAMGEVFAVVSAACLSLEYICAAAAVSRSWGDKAVQYVVETWPSSQAWMPDMTSTSTNPFAFLIATACVGLLLCGVKESKRVANVFTGLKVALVAFMVVVALWYTQPSNWVPFAPYGVSGVIRGATGTFFGYLGYDQVCCLAGEAKDAKRNLPRAVLGVLVGCAALYVVATLALTGMLPYDQISPVAGFPDGFRSIGARAAAQITALGEIITLPIVVLVTIMAQPRLQYAMAIDGLLPSMFETMDANGNLLIGTCVAGGAMILIATLVPFDKLNDMISCAVLCVLSLTDTSVVMLWHEPAHDPDSPLTCQLMMLFHVAALSGSVLVTHASQTIWGNILTMFCVVIMFATCWAISRYCPRTAVFGGKREHYHESDLVREKGYFQTPFVPALPCIAIAVNWYLIAQLDLLGIGMLLGFLFLAVLAYFAAPYSRLGNTNGFEEIEMSSEDKRGSFEPSHGLVL